MVAVPAATPVSTPAVPMVATPVAVLLQALPPEVSLRVVVFPAHTCGIPVIGPGMGITVTYTIVVSVPPPQSETNTLKESLP